MRVAIIDLGTNTFHLLIAEVENHHFKILYKTNVPVKLGEGRINDNIIIPKAFERGISALKTFRNLIDDYGVTEVKATATSAVRSAKNGSEFVLAAKASAQIDIGTITGEEEAELIYEGVKLSGAINANSLIMDIGGGSVEFILCDGENLVWKKSYNIGAARIMQKFLNSDPIADGDKNAILFHIQNELADLFAICEHNKPETLIGSAGAFETFAQLITNKNNVKIDLENVKTYHFNYDEYLETTINLINATHGERANMPGMIPLRVDMSMIAAIMVNYILGRLKINKITLSTYDLKMGVLASYL